MQCVLHEFPPLTFACMTVIWHLFTHHVLLNLIFIRLKLSKQCKQESFQEEALEDHGELGIA